MIENWLKDRFIAHRGFHDAAIRENTLKAFENAAKHGYNVELDVQLTKDYVPVIFHDLHLKRLIGVDCYVRDLTYDELKKLRYIGSDDSIPTFMEALSVCEDKTGIMIEVKKNSYDEREIKVEPIIWEILKHYKGEYVLKSFNPFSVDWLIKNTAGVKIGLLSEYEDIEEYDEEARGIVKRLLYGSNGQKVDFYDCAAALIDSPLAKSARELSLIVWTIVSQAQYDEIKNRVDNIIFENFVPIR